MSMFSRRFGLAMVAAMLCLGRRRAQAQHRCDHCKTESA